MMVTFPLFAQIQIQQKTYEDIYQIKEGRYHYGVIRVTDEGIFLCLNTDNQFEDSYASLFLGKTLESAVKTMDDIIALPVSNEYIYSYGMGGTTTKIYKYKSFGQMNLCMEADYVAGEAPCSEKILKMIREALTTLSLPEGIIRE